MEWLFIGIQPQRASGEHGPVQVDESSWFICRPSWVLLRCCLDPQKTQLTAPLSPNHLFVFFPVHLCVILTKISVILYERTNHGSRAAQVGRHTLKLQTSTFVFSTQLWIQIFNWVSIYKSGCQKSKSFFRAFVLAWEKRRWRLFKGCGFQISILKEENGSFGTNSGAH